MFLKVIHRWRLLYPVLEKPHALKTAGDPNSRLANETNGCNMGKIYPYARIARRI